MDDKTKSTTTTTMINSDVAGGDAADRLSSLPEHLISDILSKLPNYSAVATSILSRHWHHQWTYITRFHLTSLNITNCDKLFDFLITVDNILRKLNSPPTNLHTFYLEFNLPCRDADELEKANVYELCCDFLPHWFQLICSSHTERFEVFELRYHLKVHIQNSSLVSTMSSDSICSRRIRLEQNTLSLPECLFQNKTLLELILKFNTTNLSFKLPHYVHLHNLKKLSLQIYESDRQLMRTFFKSLPLLEDLNISAFLYGHDHFIDISAPSLKIFAIEVIGQDSQTNVLIDAPKLKTIKISIRGGLVLFRFVKIPTDLLETNLSHWDSVGDDLATLELLKGITGTRSLGICCRIINVLNSYNVDELPTFHNLVDLSLEIYDSANMNLAIPVWILRGMSMTKK
ncbi:putative F-box/LRR-repeat protein At4g15060 [Silene latifolia]|uniref:putative F-box/LRR-repeat protein At4g15060 n=1 Tax=Silene latifolia TaxID=37657 RepID=UPI003D76FCB1